MCAAARNAQNKAACLTGRSEDWCVIRLNLPRLKSRGSQPRILTDSDTLGYPRSSYGSYIIIYAIANVLKPSCKILIAAFISLSWTVLHLGHTHSLIPRFLTSLLIYPQI